MFKKVLKNILIIIAFWVSTAFASSANLYYSDGPWKGKVIDVETKEPIEGAVVVAIWEKVYVSPTGDHSYFYDAVEVLTDKDGNFFIPQFKAFNILPIISHIRGPNFEIFKPEYTAFPGSGLEYFQIYFPKSPLRVNRRTLEALFKEGVTVELLRLKTKEELLRNTPGLPTDVGSNKLPIYDKLINKERRDLGLEPMIIR